jgi:hypothetical protein
VRCRWGRNAPRENQSSTLLLSTSLIHKHPDPDDRENYACPDSRFSYCEYEIGNGHNANNHQFGYAPAIPFSNDDLHFSIDGF